MHIEELPDFQQSLVKYLIDKGVIMYIEDDIEYDDCIYYYFLKDSFSLDIDEAIGNTKNIFLQL